MKLEVPQTSQWCEKSHLAIRDRSVSLTRHASTEIGTPNKGGSLFHLRVYWAWLSFKEHKSKLFRSRFESIESVTPKYGTKHATGSIQINRTTTRIHGLLSRPRTETTSSIRSIFNSLDNQVQSTD